MEALRTQVVMLTNIEKIIYPENQPGGAGIWREVTSNNPITNASLINNKFKSIFCKAVFYKIFFLSTLFLLPGILKTRAQQSDNYAMYCYLAHFFMLN